MILCYRYKYKDNMNISMFVVTVVRLILLFFVAVQNFQRQSSLLFKVLSSVRSHQASSHLAQLLLRIDYNRFFSMTCSRLYNSSSFTQRT